MSALKTDAQKAEWKALRVEANNPDESTKWKFLWEFDEDDWIKTQSLLDDLEPISKPHIFSNK